MAFTTFGWECPMFVHMSWLLKSRYRLPSVVQKWTPFARATGMGSTLVWIDHSNTLCLRHRATISSPVREASSTVAIANLSRLLYPTDGPTFLFAPRSNGQAGPPEWGR